MYYHITYGLIIRSSFPLPEVIAVPEAEPDVMIRLGQIDRCPPASVGPLGHYHLTPGEAYFFWSQVGAFLVRKGNEIIIEPLSGVPEHIIRLPLLGIVFSAILQQRGILALHASAIALNGGAVAFLGHKGRGKSTLAAALHVQGYPLVGDDLAAVDVSDSPPPMVLSGFPQMKLMPESAAALGDDPEQLPRLEAGYEKRARRATAGFSSQPLPFRRLYVLDEGETLEIEPLQPKEALLSILAQSYPARLYRESLYGKEATRNFTQCVEVTKKVPAFRLRRPRSLKLLPATVQLLQAHNN